MANWLEKIMSSGMQKPGGRNLPAQRRQGALSTSSRGMVPNTLPNASIIYGVAASALFVIGLYFLLFGHRWIAGLLVMLPAGCFLGFALHSPLQFLPHPVFSSVRCVFGDRKIWQRLLFVWFSYASIKSIFNLINLLKLMIKFQKRSNFINNNKENQNRYETYH